MRQVEIQFVLYPSYQNLEGSTRNIEVCSAPQNKSYQAKH